VTLIPGEHIVSIVVYPEDEGSMFICSFDNHLLDCTSDITMKTIIWLQLQPYFRFQLYFSGIEDPELSADCSGHNTSDPSGARWLVRVLWDHRSSPSYSF
jgi:hypothetical protein